MLREIRVATDRKSSVPERRSVDKDAAGESNILIKLQLRSVKNDFPNEGYFWIPTTIRRWC